MTRGSAGLRAPASLRSALELAEEYRRRLAPACERLELSGALRRRRFQWNTSAPARLEFVAAPRTETLSPGGGGWPAWERNRLWLAVQEWAAGREFTALGGERAWEARGCCRLLNDKCELAIWLAALPAFGSVWLWRTGSRAHIEWLCERARRRRAVWTPQGGLCAGLRVHAVGEEEIYRGLGLRWVPPECREPGLFEGGQFELPGDLEA